jgi:hypothetical protein
MKKTIYPRRAVSDRKRRDIYTRIAEMTVRRYRVNWGKSILNVYQMDPDFLKIDAGLLEFMATEREGILAVLQDPHLTAQLTQLFVDTSIEFTYASNQFIQLIPEEEAVLRKLYRAYLADLQVVLETNPGVEALEASLAAVLKQHFQDLRANISRFFDRETARRAEENVILKKTVCSEYSPQLQLEVLGIRVDDLVEPVLDIGCGKSGQLVQYLAELGLQAAGADRVVQASLSLMEADWLALDFRPGTWGTVLSHMAFSNHFLFHHRYKNGQPEEYARKYMHILSWLKRGGSFYYAPGLPFIEQFLPDGVYRVTRQKIARPEISLAGQDMFLDEEPWYAARVMKR